MKLSLINTSPSDNIKREGIVAEASWPPLGILYISSFLKKHGHDVFVLDQPAKRYTIEETVKWIWEKDPDVIGLSALMHSAKTAVSISKEIKKEVSDIPIIFGNFYSSFCAEKVLKKYPSIDVIVRGEGEYTTLELVESYEKGYSLVNVEGISFRIGEEVYSTPDRSPIKDVNELPFPDRDQLDTEYDSHISGAILATKKFMSIITSRGCSYRCRFCICNEGSGQIWRPRSVDNIMKELMMLTSNDYKQILFVDDNFTTDPKRVFRLCERIQKEKLDIQWFCEGRVDGCSLEMLKSMKRAGCKAIFFGIESAHQHILDYYNKGITPELSRRAVRAARKAGIDFIIGSFILGAPHETKEEIIDTIEFAKELTIDIPSFNILRTFPGTKIWDELVEKGFIDEEKYWETGVFASDVSPGGIPSSELKRIILDALNDFFTRPNYLLNQVGLTLKSLYRLGLISSNFRRFRSIKDYFFIGDN